MNIGSALIVSLMLAALPLTVAAEGQPKGPNVIAKGSSGEVRDGTSHLRQLREAIGLAQIGWKAGDPLPLILAAEMYSKVASSPLGDKVGTEKGPKSANSHSESAGKANSDFNLSPQAWVSRAKELAKGDSTISALASKTELLLDTPRGAVGGPKVNYTDASGYSTDVYKVTFRTGEVAAVCVKGDGDTDLDLLVFDSLGNLIASDADYTDTCFVSWVPAWTGPFTIKVVNNGPIVNRYAIATN